MASVIPWGIRAIRAITRFRSMRKLARQVQKHRYALKTIHKLPVSKRAKKKSSSMGTVGPMPFYRRRKFLRRRKPLYRRRRVKKTVNKIHTFVRWCDKDSIYGEYGPNVISETGADQHLTYQFRLDQVTGVSDFTNLYDGYKINKVQLFLEPLYDSTQNVAIGAPNPRSRKLRVVHDYNDATPLTDEDEYLQYGNCKAYFPWSKRGVRITLYPKLNNVIENASGATNGFTSMNSNRYFLNMATDEVPHFGIKIFVPGILATEGTLLFRVRAKFWVSMRGTK